MTRPSGVRRVSRATGAALAITFTVTPLLTLTGCSGSSTSPASDKAAAVRSATSPASDTVTSSTVLSHSDPDAVGEGDAATIRAGAPPAFLPMLPDGAAPTPGSSASAGGPTPTVASGPDAPLAPATADASSAPSPPADSVPTTVPATVPPATAPATSTVTVPSTTPSTVPGSGWDLAAEQRFVELLNIERAAVGLAPLSVDGGLRASARSQVASMIGTQVLAHQDLHDDLDGGWGIVGENVGYGPDPETIHAALVASPGHYANLVHLRYRMVGIGVDVDANGRMWVSQVFGG